jgi:hypothetical protein
MLMLPKSVIVPRGPSSHFFVVLLALHVLHVDAAGNHVVAQRDFGRFQRGDDVFFFFEFDPVLLMNLQNHPGEEAGEE